jgi:hypothetical protein
MKNSLRRMSLGVSIDHDLTGTRDLSLVAMRHRAEAKHCLQYKHMFLSSLFVQELLSQPVIIRLGLITPRHRICITLRLQQFLQL